MGELSKVIRWSAPGSVFILLAAAAVLVANLVVGQTWWSLGSPPVMELPTLDADVVAVAVAASVPIGFLVYQLYYFAYSRPQALVLSFVHVDMAMRVRRRSRAPLRNIEPLADWAAEPTSGLHVRWPRHFRIPLTGRLRTLWLFRVPGAHVGPAHEREALSIRDLRATAGSRTAATEEYNSILKAYSRRRENNWLALESHLQERLRTQPGSDRDFKDIERLADIYHTLGASKTAVSLGWIVGNGAAFWPFLTGSTPDSWPRFVVLLGLTLAVSLVLAVGLVAVLHQNRGHCARRRVALIETALKDPAAD